MLMIDRMDIPLGDGVLPKPSDYVEETFVPVTERHLLNKPFGARETYTAEMANSGIEIEQIVIGKLQKMIERNIHQECHFCSNKMIRTNSEKFPVWGSYAITMMATCESKICTAPGRGRVVSFDGAKIRKDMEVIFENEVTGSW